MKNVSENPLQPGILKKIKNKIFLNLCRSYWFPASLRRKFACAGGVKIGKSFIGDNVGFDTEFPSDITIGDYCAITSGVQIITHFVHSSKHREHWYTRGKVKIGNNVHIGMNAMIVQPITIGDDVIIGAGSVVTKNIPSGEIWGGIPAKFIKKVEGYE